MTISISILLLSSSPFTWQTQPQQDFSWLLPLSLSLICMHRHTKGTKTVKYWWSTKIITFFVFLTLIKTDQSIISHFSLRQILFRKLIWWVWELINLWREKKSNTFASLKSAFLASFMSFSLQDKSSLDVNTTAVWEEYPFCFCCGIPC